MNRVALRFNAMVRGMMCLAICVWAVAAQAQILEGEDNGNRFAWGRDSTHTKKTDVPVGMFQWTIDPLLGEIIPQAEVDTLMQGFQNINNTEGERGTYSYTGAHGAPRLSRLYLERPVVSGRFPFLDGYDYFLPDISTFRFSNTKSPITNMSYLRAGSSSKGNDRLRTYFASNINKRSGYGFLLDYLYCRGQYTNQQNSMFNGSAYGYYHGDYYQMHAWLSVNHLKMAENGGIESDDYIRHPEKFERSFDAADIPTLMTDTWNRTEDQTYYLTHRANMGYRRRLELPDSLLPHIAPDDELLNAAFNDSILEVLRADSARMAFTLDTLRAKAERELVYPDEFVPVASIIHTFKAQYTRHRYSSHKVDVNADYYAYDYGWGPEMNEKNYGQTFTNTVALSLREGFRKWVKAGLTAFVTHDYAKYSLPDTTSYVENNVSVGGSFARTGGKTLHFNATGTVVIAGEKAGDLNIDGTADLNFRLWRDTCSLTAHAYLRNDKPNFYFRHYGSRFARWNNSLDQEVRTRIEGMFRLKKLGTRLRVGVENIANYTYFGVKLAPGSDPDVVRYTHAVAPVQASGSVQVVSATVSQDLHVSLFHWENELTYQKSSREEVLPLPALNYWTNMYIQFRIARVLNVQLGADMRYFTKYYAPDYSPIVNTFANQDRDYAVKVGGYPIIDVYVNAHLKHFRAYFSVQHVNSSMNGNAFLVPHYPINPLTIHFGISWNFFN